MGNKFIFMEATLGINRLAHIRDIYLKVVYFQDAEEKDPECSLAVLEACRITKSALYREYNSISSRGKAQNQ